MEVGDLVQQRTAGVAIISEYIRSSLHMGCIGIITKVHDKTNFSYDDSDSLENTPLMKVINSFLDEKNYENEKTAEKAERAIKTLHESFGNIPINEINPA